MIWGGGGLTSWYLLGTQQTQNKKYLYKICTKHVRNHLTLQGPLLPTSQTVFSMMGCSRLLANKTLKSAICDVGSNGPCGGRWCETNPWRCRTTSSGLEQYCSLACPLVSYCDVEGQQNLMLWKTICRFIHRPRSRGGGYCHHHVWPCGRASAFCFWTLSRRP